MVVVVVVAAAGSGTYTHGGAWWRLVMTQGGFGGD